MQLSWRVVKDARPMHMAIAATIIAATAFFAASWHVDMRQILAHLHSWWEMISPHFKSLTRVMKDYVNPVMIIFNHYLTPCALGVAYYWRSKPAPRGHILSIQLNSLFSPAAQRRMRAAVPTNVTTSDFLSWTTLHEDVVPEYGDGALRAKLAEARSKPFALQHAESELSACPSLCLLDTGPHARHGAAPSLVWQYLYGMCISRVANTDAELSAAMGVPVHRECLIACITFESSEKLGDYNMGRKMRLIMMSLSHLRRLHEECQANPDAVVTHSSWAAQRKLQLLELATHVFETGGFSDPLANDDPRALLPRYYMALWTTRVLHPDGHDVTQDE